MSTHFSKVRITTDALRMRCRRLCEKKPSGKLQVEQDIVDRYKSGGTDREELEMALLESLAKWGLERSNYKKIKAQHSSVHVQKNAKPMVNQVFPIYSWALCFRLTLWCDANGWGKGWKTKSRKCMASGIQKMLSKKAENTARAVSKPWWLTANVFQSRWWGQVSISWYCNLQSYQNNTYTANNFYTYDKTVLQKTPGSHIHDPWLFFPNLPCRFWRYNENINEYYIIDEDKTLHRKAERTKETEEVDLGASWLYYNREKSGTSFEGHTKCIQSSLNENTWHTFMILDLHMALNMYIPKWQLFSTQI